MSSVGAIADRHDDNNMLFSKRIKNISKHINIALNNEFTLKPKGNRPLGGP
jgi:hypothetical protein